MTQPLPPKLAKAVSEQNRRSSDLATRLIQGQQQKSYRPAVETKRLGAESAGKILQRK